MTSSIGPVSYAVRRLLRAPAFSLTIVGTLAIGLGANATILSVVNAIVWRPLTIREPGRVAVISLWDRTGQQVRLIPYEAFVEFAQQQQSFEGVSAYSGGGIVTINARGTLAGALLEASTPDYFDIVGAKPFLGRLLSPADAPISGDPASVVVISHRLWRNQLASDPQVVGSTLDVEGTPLRVLGVLAPGFRGLQFDSGADLYLPLPLLRRLSGDPRRPIRAINIVGRLRSGVTLATANAEVATLWPRLANTTMAPGLSPKEQADIRSQQVRVRSGALGFSWLRDQYTNSLYVLLALTVGLLVMICANLSGLFTARTTALGQEFALRLALGASRRSLLQQTVTETVILAVCGGALGLPIAWWTSQAVGVALWADSNPLAVSMRPDLKVLAGMTVGVIAIGILIGIAPTWLATRSAVQHDLGPVRQFAFAGSRYARALLIGQVALSTVLVIGAMLFARSLMNLRALDPGFRVDRVLWTRLVPQPGGYRRVDNTTYHPELLGRISSLPYVEAATLSHLFPTYIDSPPPTQVVTKVPEAESELAVPVEAISPQFFSTTGIAIRRGRDFTWQDVTTTTPVAIINEALSSRLFQGFDPVGRQIRLGRDPSRSVLQIVAVVADAGVGNIRESHQPLVFRPMLQEPQMSRVPILLVKLKGESSAVEPALRGIVASLGHEYIRAIFTLERQVADSLIKERLTVALSVFFAAVAVLLSSIGTYGLLSYSVTRRTRELGIRAALGASRWSAVRLVVYEGLRICAIGALCGAVAAVGLATFVRSLLFNVSPLTAAPLTVVVGFFLCVGALASAIPALRASALEAAVALRHD